MTNSLYSNQNRVHGGYYSKPSLAWVLFGFWLNHIARYAQSLKSQKSLQPSDPGALKFMRWALNNLELI